jgi:haloalkane dehalogenase
MNNPISAIRKALVIAIFSLPLASQINAQDAPPPKPTGPAISSEFSFAPHYVQVKGSQMHYVDEGEGDPILFLHGNPTSSYLWRNIIPYVTPHGRAIAVDLIGMGKSGKPDIDYRFATHAEYLGAFIEALDLTNITLVIHDWGSALGMDFARRNPDQVKGIVFMEAIVPPAMPIPSYEAMGRGGEFFRDVRTPGVGEEMILQNNMFVEVVLPKLGTVRKLTDTERQAYRAPYPTPESRKPTLVWPREVPIAGEPADVLEIVKRNGAWLHETSIPKLMFYAEPGAFGGPEVAAYFAENLKNIETNYVGPGYHYIQEDHPHMIGRELADWLRRHK